MARSHHLPVQKFSAGARLGHRQLGIAKPDLLASGPRARRVRVRVAVVCVVPSSGHALRLSGEFSLFPCEPQNSEAKKVRALSDSFYQRANREAERLNLWPGVLEPLNIGPELALRVASLLIPFSLPDLWSWAVQQTFMLGLLWVRHRARCGGTPWAPFVHGRDD